MLAKVLKDIANILKSEYCIELTNPKIELVDRKQKLTLPVVVHFRLSTKQKIVRTGHLSDVYADLVYRFINIEKLIQLQKLLSEENKQLPPFHEISIPRYANITTPFRKLVKEATHGCDFCNHTGFRSVSEDEQTVTYKRVADEVLKTCQICNGRGRVSCRNTLCNFGKVTCSFCNGSARDHWSGNCCTHCYGEGRKNCSYCNFGEIGCNACDSKGSTVETRYRDIEEYNSIPLIKTKPCLCTESTYESVYHPVTHYTLPVMITALSKEQFESKSWSRLFIPPSQQNNFLREITYGNKYEWLANEYPDRVAATGKLIAENVVCYELRNDKYVWKVFIINESSDFVIAEVA